MKETIAKIIHLARLRIPEQELKKFADKAQHIVDYVEQLKAVDTSKVGATSHAVEVEGILREDLVKTFSPVENILKLAPQKQGNLFQVPKVIE